VAGQATSSYVDGSAPPGPYYLVRAFYLGWESANSNGATPAIEDYDGLPAAIDNCPAAFNVVQLDTDASSRTLTDTGQVLNGGRTFGVATGDIDGDGDLDLVLADDGGPNRVWRNDGAGVFSDTGQALGGTSGSAAAALGDLDGDGDLDVVFANQGEPNTVWRNNGDATFTDSGQALGASSRTTGVALGDFDRDLDVAFSNMIDADTVWRNG